MKGGLAAIIAAGAAAKQLRLRGDIIVTAVADEEYASIGTSSIVKSWHADAAIVTEPTHLNICVAHKGFIWLEVQTIGVAAHGSLPHVGIDAIAKMGKVLVGLEELDHRLRSAPSHRLLKSGSVHASLIQGGQELSSYPESCTLGVERRTIPGETQQQVESELPTIFERIATTDPNFKATVKTLLVRDAFEVSEDEPIVQALRRQATALLGHEPEVIGQTAWMDSAILSAAGIPTVVFGPGGEGAHAVVEWSDLAQVEQCADVLTAVAKEFCG